MLELAGPAPLAGETVSIELYKGGTLYATLVSSTDNDYSWTYAGPVPMDWDPASNYQIKVTDELGNWGMSDQFTVEGASGMEIITVTDPSASTDWYTLQPGTEVSWEYPTDSRGDFLAAIPFAERIRSAVRESTPLFTDSVSIEIWKSGVYLADYSDGLVANTDSYTRTEAIPSSWGTGSNYQIKVIDTNMNFGCSEQFSISSGEISVTQPTTGTIWDIGQTGIQVTWTGGTTVVKLELWSDGVMVDPDFSPFITNTGSYTYPNPAPASWDIGEHYQIHIRNSDSSQHGWSEEFQVFNEIDVIHPQTNTIWAWSQDSLSVTWNDPFGDSVFVDVYKGGTYLDSFLGWTANDGIDTRIMSVPSSWSVGDDFQLRIENNKGSYGFSDEFDIWAIEVLQPDSNTVWYHGQTDCEVTWGSVPGSHVRIIVCHEGDSIGTFTPQGQWIDASMGSYTRTEPMPADWADIDCQIKVIDNSGNIGWSDEFYSIGQLAVWGCNSYGQCNVPSPNAGFVAISAGVDHSLGLKADGSIVAWGRNSSGQCNVPSPNAGFVAVSGGYVHSMGLKENGSIVAWGGNGDGQCNVPSPNTGFVAVAAGEFHSLGLKEDGSIVAWGWNDYGTCNVPSPNTGFVAVSGGFLHSLGLKEDGSIVAWGLNNCGQCTVPPPNTGFVAVAAGEYHSLGLKEDGSIVAWGYNNHGQCNVPSPNIGFIAVAGGSNHSMGLKENGSIVAWGSNSDGQCNVPTAPSTGWSSLAAGANHSLALK